MRNRYLYLGKDIFLNIKHMHHENGKIGNIYETVFYFFFFYLILVLGKYNVECQTHFFKQYHHTLAWILVRERMRASNFHNFYSVLTTLTFKVLNFCFVLPTFTNHPFNGRKHCLNIMCEFH